METKIETLEGVEPRALQSSISASSPKVSKFGSKSGFVIPKNKLSGSLVPIFRGSAKAGPAVALKEENSQQDRRKTKWGADPIQDTAVRKGRILAYQTRLEQITELLKAGSLEIEENHERESASPSSNDAFKASLVDTEKLVQLELEKREVIGEILKLNPGYKAPPDYKPVLKEDKIPVPTKSYPGYNFIVLLLGPESNALKRLEEETGVKVRVYGTRAGTGEKKEITQSDTNEAQSNYEDIYVHVSAETFEKVDAAIALIELLLTPVNVNHTVATTTNLTTGDGGKVPDPGQKDSTSSYPIMPGSTTGHTTLPQTAMPAQSAPSQYQTHPNPWYPIGPTNVSMPSPSGFMAPPMPNNGVSFPASSNMVSNIHQPFGIRPFVQVPGNFSGIPISQAQPPTQVLQRPMIPAPQYSNVISPAQQPPMHPHAPSRPISFPTAAPSMPVGGMPLARPFLPQIPRAGPAFQMGTATNQPSMTRAPLVNTGWSNAPSMTLPPRPINVHNALPQNPVQRPPAITPQAPIVSHPPQNFPRAAGVPAISSQAMSTFPYRPAASGGLPSVQTFSGPAPITPPAYPPTPASGPSPMIFPLAPQVPLSGSAASPISAQISISGQSLQPVVPHPLISAQSFPPGQASNSALPHMPTSQQQTPGPVTSISVSIYAGGSSAPPVTTPKPPRPSSSDFTFQPLGSSASTPPSRPLNEQRSAFPLHLHVPSQSLIPPNAPQGLPGPGAPQPLAAAPPQSPSFRPALHNPGNMGVMPLQRPVPIMTPATASAVTIPAGNVNIPQPPPRPIYPNHPNARAVGPMNPQGPSFPPPQAQNPGLPLARSAILMQHPNQLHPATQPRTVMIQGQQLVGNNTGFVPAPNPGGSQNYDPFSPTSVPTGGPPNQDVRPKTRTETDVEYEDLMASMGVR